MPAYLPASPRVTSSGVTPMHDRATAVARVAMRLLIDTLNKEFTPTEFHQRLETLLRDEFADERARRWPIGSCRMLNRLAEATVETVLRDGTAHVLHRDYETRGTIRLNSVGAYRYAADRRTEVLCAAYARDDQP